jgi:hypothetical protein
MTDIALPSVSRRRITAFHLLVGVFILFQATIAGLLMPYLPGVVIGWFDPEYSGFIIGGAANVVLLAALIVQFHRPERKVAGIQMLIILLFSSMITSLISGGFGSFFYLLLLMIGGIAMLHPGRRDIPRFGRPGNPELLVLAGLALVPVVTYALNRDFNSEANIAIYSWLFALLATFKTPGWRVPAWSAGFIAIIYGLTSLIYPGLASSVSPLWGILAIVWGLVFIGVAEWKRFKERQA